MMAHVPPPSVLIGRESRDGFYALIADVRGAETDRELLHHMERFMNAQREWRELFTLVERELFGKLREFRELTERELLEPSTDREARLRGDT